MIKNAIIVFFVVLLGSIIVLTMSILDHSPSNKERERFFSEIVLLGKTNEINSTKFVSSNSIVEIQVMHVDDLYNLLGSFEEVRLKKSMRITRPYTIIFTQNDTQYDYIFGIYEDEEHVSISVGGNTEDRRTYRFSKNLTPSAYKLKKNLINAKY